MVLPACASRRGSKASRGPEDQPWPIIRKVELEGVSIFSEDEFLEHLEIRPSPKLLPNRRVYYVPALERIDAERIVELYAAYGHFEARVRHITAQPVDRRGRREWVDVQIAVHEGPATYVREVVLAGALPKSLDGVVAKIRGMQGQRFSIADFNAADQQLEGALAARGYAFARVSESAEVDRDQRWARLRYEIDAGQPVHVSGFDLRGLKILPGKPVLRELEDFVDRRYSPALAAEIEARVYDMGVFTAVSTELAEMAQHKAGRARVRVYVTEKRMQSVRVGGGIHIDPLRWEQSAELRYRNEHLFRRLVKFDARLRAGWAQLDPFTKLFEHGPLAELELSFTKKGWLERGLVWRYRPSTELGVEPGYQFWSVRNRLSVSRFLGRRLEWSLGYDHRVVGFFDDAGLREGIAGSFLGLDHRNPYALGQISLTTTGHFTDQIVTPTRGVRLTLNYDLAHRVFGSQFDHHRWSFDARAYLPLMARWHLAARIGFGFIVPFGERGGAPIDQRFHLGGSSDVRGWGTRRLSPRVDPPCLEQGTDESDQSARNIDRCSQIPVGGHTFVLANFESRWRLVADLWLSAFIDVGDVRWGLVEIVPSGWQPSVGGGLQWQAEIGVLRIDFGHRILTDLERFPDERLWGIHFSFGQAF